MQFEIAAYSNCLVSKVEIGNFDLKFRVGAIHELPLHFGDKSYSFLRNAARNIPLYNSGCAGII